MRKARRTQLDAVGLVAAVGDGIDTKLTLRVLDSRIGLTGRHMHALCEQLEVMDQLLHAGLHLLARRRCHLVVVGDHRSRILAQPVDALPDDAVGLTHLLDAHQVTVVAVAIDADRHVERHAIVNLVGLLLAQIPLDARAAQHRAGETQRQCPFRGDHADADGALLPDAVIGEQRLVLVYAGRESIREILKEIEQRALARLIKPAHGLGILELVDLVLRHVVRQVAIDAAGTIIGRMQACAGDGLVHVHQVLALAECVQHHGHGADVECVRADVEQVIEDARHLVHQDADVLGADRHLDAEQFLDGHDVGVLVAHHGNVVETIQVGNGLQPGPGFRQLLGGAMQQADMRVGANDHFTVKFQHQTQYPMRRGMLRTEVDRVIADLSHAPRPRSFPRG